MGVPQLATFGSPGPFSQIAPSGTTFTLDATTDAFEVIFRAPEAATLTRAAISSPSSAPAGTATTWAIGLQGVGSTGVPDGTWLGGGTPAKATFTNTSVTASAVNWFNFANSYACTRGQLMALVVQYDSGTAPSAGVNDLPLVTTHSWAPIFGFPYPITNNGGSRTRLTTSPPLCGVGSASKAYLYPARSAAFSTGFNSGSTPDEYAMRFVVPADWCSTYSVAGVRFMGQFPAAASNNTLVRLYDGTTVLQTVDFNTDAIQSAGNTRVFELYFTDTTLATLTAGSVYRVGFAPQTANNIIIRGITFTAAADNEAFPNGDEVYMSSRTDSGSWTDDDTSRLICELILVDLAEPAGGSVALPPIGSMIG